jgi:cytidylate kinase
MNLPFGLEQCHAFINCHVQPPTPKHFVDGAVKRRAVTFSRQSGSGGHSVAERLAEYLQAHSGKDEPPWTIFDRELVQKVIQEHHLPERLARFMLEDRISEISDTMDELFGLHPPSWTLVRKISETVLHLAELGNVILIGRGANVITSKLDYVFHVRLISSLEKRMERMQALKGFTAKQAREFILREDRGRGRYLKKYFNKDIDDPLSYHLTVNTDWIPYDEAAHLIAEAVLSGKIQNKLVAG